MLKFFFENYKGHLIFHNAPFDAKVLIFQLWMTYISDTKGLLEGMEHILGKENLMFEDTKVIAYLSLNTVSEISLSLKDLSHEYLGNYGQTSEDIVDIRRIPLPKLLKYNAYDTVGTWYVYLKYKPRMQADKQFDIYNNVMLPGQRMLTQVELTGMPIDLNRVAEVKEQLSTLRTEEEAKLRKFPFIAEAEKQLKFDAWMLTMKKEYPKAKKPENIKRNPIEEFKEEPFNFGSGKQLQKLFYSVMGLPVLERTKTRQPATDKKTLDKLINHTDNEDFKAIIQGILDMSEATKILSTFITALEKLFGVSILNALTYLDRFILALCQED